MHNMSHSSHWHYDIHLIKPGNSAVLGESFVGFYIVHTVGIISTGISVIASVIVILNILNHRCWKRWDFSDRFPLYLAIADGLWGVINLTTDHLVLLVTQTYPPEEIATLISIILHFFLGYQQLMNSGLALFTYCKVVRHTHIDFGVAEWKLHFSCIVFVLLVTAVVLPLGGFGCSGFWFLANSQTKSGKYFQLFVATCGTIATICTLWSYREIRRVVQEQRRIVTFINLYEGKSSCFHLSTATECLTTFIYVSLFLYIPMITTCWVFCLLFVVYSSVDPITAFFVVILANGSGWANAWAYFHNKKIKQLGKLRKMSSNNNGHTGNNSTIECRLVKLNHKSKSAEMY